MYILENYFDYNYDEIVQEYHDTFPDDDETFDTLKIAAQVLGRKIKKYLHQSSTLERYVNKLLEENLQSPESSNMAIEWARLKDYTVVYSFSIIESLKQGIE